MSVGYNVSNLLYDLLCSQDEEYDSVSKCALSGTQVGTNVAMKLAVWDIQVGINCAEKHVVWHLLHGAESILRS